MEWTYVDQKRSLEIFVQICRGVKVLHDPPLKMIHRDLKPANILFSRMKNNLVKLGDLGLITMRDEFKDDLENFDLSVSKNKFIALHFNSFILTAIRPETCYTIIFIIMILKIQTNQSSTFLDGSIHTGGVGTRLYMAPEIREGKVYSSPVDIYALGIILLELFCTFQTGSERIQIILQVTQAHSLPEELTLYKGY